MEMFLIIILSTAGPSTAEQRCCLWGASSDSLRREDLDKENLALEVASTRQVCGGGVTPRDGGDNRSSRTSIVDTWTSSWMFLKSCYGERPAGCWLVTGANWFQPHISSSSALLPDWAQPTREHDTANLCLIGTMLSEGVNDISR